jgi:hypothetical protein
VNVPWVPRSQDGTGGAKARDLAQQDLEGGFSVLRARKTSAQCQRSQR